MITPTNGRVVWFHPNGTSRPGFSFYGKQPCAAQVVYVHSDRMVNLAVNDHSGTHFPFSSVPLVQEGDDKPAPGTAYCEWMPYQKGQAARADTAAAGAASVPLT